MELTFEIENLRKEKTPAYCRYDTQTSPQDAYIELNPDDKTISYSHDCEIGGMLPFSVAHGRVLRFDIPNNVKGSALAEIFEEKAFKKAVKKIIKGYSEEWDGQNHKGKLTKKAEKAREKIEALLESLNEDQNRFDVWDASEWMFSFDQLEQHWPGNMPIEEAVKDVQEFANSEGVVLDGDIEKELLRKAQELLDDDDEELGAEHMKALRENGMAE